MFTALVPPAAMLEDLDAFLAPRRDAEPRLRWTPPHSWHVTTSFMGDVPAHALEPLADNLKDVAARTAPFAVRLGGGGTFGFPKQAKLLYLGVPLGADELASLSRRARTAGERAGAHADGGPYTPHLTLARSSRGVDVTRLLGVLDTFDPSGWVADELVLIESHLHDRAQRYEVLDRFRFTHERARDADSSPGTTP